MKIKLMRVDTLIIMKWPTLGMYTTEGNLVKMCWSRIFCAKKKQVRIRLIIGQGMKTTLKIQKDKNKSLHSVGE